MEPTPSFDRSAVVPPHCSAARVGTEAETANASHRLRRRSGCARSPSAAGAAPRRCARGCRALFRKAGAVEPAEPVKVLLAGASVGVAGRAPSGARDLSLGPRGGNAEPVGCPCGSWDSRCCSRSRSRSRVAARSRAPSAAEVARPSAAAAPAPTPARCPVDFTAPFVDGAAAWHEEPVAAPKKMAWEEALGGKEAARSHVRARLRGWPSRLLVDRGGCRATSAPSSSASRATPGAASTRSRPRERPARRPRAARGGARAAGADAAVPAVTGQVGDYTNVTNIGLHLVAIVAARELGLCRADDGARAQRADPRHARPTRDATRASSTTSTTRPRSSAPATSSRSSTCRG